MNKFLACILLICLTFILAACGIQSDTTLSQTVEATSIPTSVTDMEEMEFCIETVDLVEAKDGLGADYATSKTMEVTQYCDTIYAFDPSISLDDRKQCIQATKTILDGIGVEQRIQINIYTTGSYPYTFVDTGMVHTHVQDWIGVDYTIAVLYGIFGEYCNYGLLYGYANYILSELYGIPFDILSESWNYAGNIDTLDLNLLCFRSEFVDEESITSIQRIANTFVSDYIENNGKTAFHELLQNSGDVDTVDIFAQALFAYYADKRIEHTPTNILYRLGGKGYDFIVKCPYAVIYIEEDWFDANKDLCPYTYDNFLHESYSDTRNYFAINIAQMNQYQDLFALDSYNHDLKIYFTNHSDGNYSHYNGNRHAIALYNTASLMHEYIHSLTLGCSMQEEWTAEGFARYYSYRYDYYGNAMSTVDYNSAPDTAKFRWIHEYKRNIGRDIDVEKDITELWHIATYVNGYDDPNDGGGYTAGASFIAYLISRFGDEKVIEIICKTHNFEEYSYDQLVADWRLFIQENYSMYTKVK